MGYTTEFEGKIDIVPALNAEEVSYLKKFSYTRRMLRKNGPYYCGAGFAGQDHEPDIQNYNEPPKGQPSLWCQWEPSEDGSSLAWNEVEKFYEADEWMRYLIDEFLSGAKPRHQQAIDAGYMPVFQPHVCNGEIKAQGEDPDDKWILVVKDNVVTRTDV